jgi:hypothetical protein
MKRNEIEGQMVGYLEDRYKLSGSVSVGNFLCSLITVIHSGRNLCCGFN